MLQENMLQRNRCDKETMISLSVDVDGKYNRSPSKTMDDGIIVSTAAVVCVRAQRRWFCSEKDFFHGKTVQILSLSSSFSFFTGI